MSQPALLIALPGGFYVSGVVTWAVQLVNHLAAAGRSCGILLHAQREGYPAIHPRLDPRVKVFDLAALGSFESCNGQLSRFTDAYVAAAQAMGTSRIILSPNLEGDCYAAAAGALQALGDQLRIVGWCHLDSAYDVRVLEYFNPMLSRTIAVSRHIGRCLAHLDRTIEVPYGVGPAATPEVRGTREGERAPLKLVYAGRLDEPIKRVSALVEMSRCLEREGVPHELTLLGDGPAAGTLRPTASMRLRGGVAPHEVAAAFSRADLFVLPSKAEGLSLAMLEAMLGGCVPVVTHVRSGAAQVITHGLNGMLVDATDDLSSAILGERMAGAVRHLWNRGRSELARMSAVAIAAAQPYSIDEHVRRVSVMLDEVAAEPARVWEGPLSFLGSAVAPSTGRERLRAVLQSLGGQRVVIHGTGRHTREMADVIESFRDRIVGFCDDDCTKVGASMLGLPISAPPGPAEATAVVISSWIHEREILARARAAYGGKRVLGVYHDAA